MYHLHLIEIYGSELYKLFFAYTGMKQNHVQPRTHIHLNVHGLSCLDFLYFFSLFNFKLFVDLHDSSMIINIWPTCIYIYIFKKTNKNKKLGQTFSTYIQLKNNSNLGFINLNMLKLNTACVFLDIICEKVCITFYTITVHSMRQYVINNCDC